MNVENYFQALASKRLVSRYLVFKCVIISSAQVFGQGYLSPAFFVSLKNKAGSFPLVNKQIAASILVDETDAEVVRGSAAGYRNCIKLLIYT